MFKIMESEFYCTKNEAGKSSKLLTILFKHIFTIQNAKNCQNCFGICSYDFPRLVAGDSSSSVSTSVRFCKASFGQPRGFGLVDPPITPCVA